VPCRYNGSIYAIKVFGMNEAPRLSDRRGRQGMSMRACSAHVALDLTGSDVRAECTERGAIKG
jgi:hypothetical protein